MPPPAPYNYFYIDSFKKNLNKLTKRNSKLNKQVTDKIEDLSLDPYHNTIVLKDPKFLGKRRIWIGKYRMGFKICEECRQNGHDEAENCKECNIRDDHSLVFFFLDKRSHAYE